jgi:hypothetical protein
MTLSYAADSSAPPEAAWALISRPSEWRRWAPHLRGAVGMGQPEVHAGALGFALLGGLVPVPGVVLGKRPGRRWSWQVGLIRVDHTVEPRPGGCRVIVDLSAPWPLERLLAVSYGPIVAVLVRRLAAIASHG